MRHWAAAAILVLLAATNRVVVATDTLSPWELGGFGMFASIDSPGSRVIRVTAIGEDGIERFLALPEQVGSLEDQLRVWPSTSRLESTAERIEQLTFSVENGVLVYDDSGSSVDVRRIEILKLVGIDDGVGLERIASLDHERTS